MGLATAILLLSVSIAAVNANCSVADWSSSFDKKGISRCDRGNDFINGFYRNSAGNQRISLLEEAECCRRPSPWRSSDYVCEHADWRSLLGSNNRWATCPQGFFLNGLYRNDEKGHINHIEEGRCVKPSDAPRHYDSCYDQDIKVCFDDKGWCKCDRKDYFVTGLWRGSCNKLNCIDKLKCCRPARGKETLDELFKVKNYIMDLTLRDMAYLANYMGYGWCGGCRSPWVGDDFYRSGDTWVADKSRRCDGHKSKHRLSLAFGDWSFGTKNIYYSSPVLDELQPETIDSGVLENNVDSPATKSVSRSERSIRSVTHKTTSSWKASHELAIEINYTPPGATGGVGGSVSYTFGYESGSTTTDSTKNEQWKMFSISSSKTLEPYTSVAWKMVLSKTRSTMSYTAVVLTRFSTEFQGFLRWGGGSSSTTTNYHADHKGSKSRPTVNYKFGDANKPFYTDLYQQVSTGSRPWLWNELKNAYSGASVVINKLTRESKYTLNLRGTFADVLGKQVHFSWDPPKEFRQSEGSQKKTSDTGTGHRNITTVARAGPNDLPAPSPASPRVAAAVSRSVEDTAPVMLPLIGDITDDLQ